MSTKFLFQDKMCDETKKEVEDQLASAFAVNIPVNIPVSCNVIVWLAGRCWPVVWCVMV
jgi:hypothetical protein